MKAALRPLVGRSLRPAALPLCPNGSDSSSISRNSSSYASSSRPTWSISCSCALAGPSTGLPRIAPPTGARAYASRSTSVDDGWVQVGTEGELEMEDGRPYLEEGEGEHDKPERLERPQEDLGPFGDWSGRAAAARRPSVAEHIRLGHKSKGMKLDERTKAVMLDLHRRDPIAHDARGLRRLYPYMKLRAIRAILAENGDGFEEDDDEFVARSEELSEELDELQRAAIGLGDDPFADVGFVSGDEAPELERERAELMRAWQRQGFLRRPAPFDKSDPTKPKWADEGRIHRQRPRSDVAFLPNREGDASTFLTRDAKVALLAAKRPVGPAPIDGGDRRGRPDPVDGGYKQSRPAFGESGDRPSRYGPPFEQSSSRLPERSSGRPPPRGADRRSSGGRGSSSTSFGLRSSASPVVERVRPPLVKSTLPHFAGPKTPPAPTGGRFVIPRNTVDELRRKREQQAKLKEAASTYPVAGPGGATSV